MPIRWRTVLGNASYHVSRVVLLPREDNSKQHVSSLLTCTLVNYLVIGNPVFASIWGADENQVVSMIAWANDLFTAPLYIVMSNF
jgi:NAD/NADP transhydrogenase beta subunit